MVYGDDVGYSVEGLRDILEVAREIQLKRKYILREFLVQQEKEGYTVEEQRETSQEIYN